MKFNFTILIILFLQYFVPLTKVTKSFCHDYDEIYYHDLFISIKNNIST